MIQGLRGDTWAKAVGFGFVRLCYRTFSPGALRLIGLGIEMFVLFEGPFPSAEGLRSRNSDTARRGSWFLLKV